MLVLLQVLLLALHRWRGCSSYHPVPSASLLLAAFFDPGREADEEPKIEEGEPYDGHDHSHSHSHAHEHEHHDGDDCGGEEGGCTHGALTVPLFVVICWLCRFGARGLACVCSHDLVFGLVLSS